jgi:hypothetical protein
MVVLLLLLQAVTATQASGVTFSTLTNLGDFWGGYHATVNGVVEVNKYRSLMSCLSRLSSVPSHLW